MSTVLVDPENIQEYFGEENRAISFISSQLWIERGFLRDNMENFTFLWLKSVMTHLFIPKKSVASTALHLQMGN